MYIYIVSLTIVFIRTEETCRQEIQGRYGCAIPNEYEKTFWFWQKEDCECKQGTGDYLFELVYIDRYIFVNKFI